MCWKDSNLLISTNVRKLEGAEIILFRSATPTTPGRGEDVVFSHPVNFTTVLIFNEPH